MVDSTAPVFCLVSIAGRANRNAVDDERSVSGRLVGHA